MTQAEVLPSACLVELAPSCSWNLVTTMQTACLLTTAKCLSQSWVCSACSVHDSCNFLLRLYSCLSSTHSPKYLLSICNVEIIVLGPGMTKKDKAPALVERRQ